MSLELKILGSNSAAFAHNRHHTSQFLRIQNTYFLIDCGEGTQLLLKKNKIKLSRINHILISHLHGDHYYGLIGLISTMHLFGRKATLCIYGPPMLADIITLQLKASNTRLSYDIDFKQWTPDQQELIFENNHMTVTTFPMNHRIPCSGFLFREKPKKRRINKEVVDSMLTPIQVMALKNGEDALDMDGNVLYENKLATLPPRPSRAYAFCSDTQYLPDLAEVVKGVDLLYHEATFTEDMAERAELTYHSTARQAAELANNANVGKLLLGHFSTRFRELAPVLNEALEVFPRSVLANEGESFTID